MKRSRSAALAVAMAACSWSARATAMSCISFEDRFIVECQRGACRPILRARDVGAFGGACQRRLQTESIPPWIEGELSRVAAGAGWERGMYSIAYEYKGPVDPRSLQELAARPVLTVLDGTASSVTTAFARRAGDELWAERRRKLFEVFVGVVMLALIVATSRSFWRKLSAGDRANRPWAPLVAQAGLMVAGIVWAPFALFTGTAVALTLSVPVLLLLLVVEIGGWVFGGAPANEGSRG